jgi:hypothetical protein
MSRSLPRTMAAQKADPHEWIGIFATEQMAIFLQQTEDTGQLSTPTATLLRHCLPELGHQVESLCPVTMEATPGGLCTLYGFPKTRGFPVIVSVIHFDQEQPVAASVSGIVRHWRDQPGREPNPSEQWRDIIAATLAGEWDTASNHLTARMARDGGGHRVAQHFKTQNTPDAQLVVVALAAGDRQQACGCTSILSLPALVLPANTLQVTLGSAT